MAADKPAGEAPTPRVLKRWDTQGWADPGAESVGTRGWGPEGDFNLGVHFSPPSSPSTVPYVSLWAPDR